MGKYFYNISLKIGVGILAGVVAGYAIKNGAEFIVNLSSDES